jgi:hypothetical protein
MRFDSSESAGVDDGERLRLEDALADEIAGQSGIAVGREIRHVLRFHLERVELSPAGIAPERGDRKGKREPDAAAIDNGRKERVNEPESLQLEPAATQRMLNALPTKPTTCSPR